LTAMGRTLQDELRRLAKPRGVRLFAEPAGDLRERLALYWSAACDLTTLAPPKENGEKVRTSRKETANRRPRAQAASRGSPPSRSRRAAGR